MMIKQIFGPVLLSYICNLFMFPQFISYRCTSQIYVPNQYSLGGYKFNRIQNFLFWPHIRCESGLGDTPMWGLYLNKFLCGNYLYDGSLPQGGINKIF